MEPTGRERDDAGDGPWSAWMALLGHDELRAVDAVGIDRTLLTHGRAYRVDWKRRFILAR